MIVEFAGCPGAGKTTLAFETARRLPEVPLCLHLNPGGTIAQTLTNVAATPFFALACALYSRTGLRPAKLVWNRSRDRVTASRWRAARGASAVRRLGRDAIMRRRETSIHLVDEGVSGLIELALSGAVVASEDDLQYLVHLLPPPHLIVFLRAPTQLLLKRAATRADPPREWRNLTLNATVERFERLTWMLEQFLANNLALRSISLESPVERDSTAAAAERVSTAVRDCWRETTAKNFPRHT